MTDKRFSILVLDSEACADKHAECGCKSSATSRISPPSGNSSGISGPSLVEGIGVAAFSGGGILGGGIPTPTNSETCVGTVCCTTTASYSYILGKIVYTTNCENSANGTTWTITMYE